MNVLTYLTQQLVKVNNVVGIQILNEPSNVDSLPSFCPSSVKRGERQELISNSQTLRR